MKYHDGALLTVAERPLGAALFAWLTEADASDRRRAWVSNVGEKAARALAGVDSSLRLARSGWRRLWTQEAD
jgi:hypothetical protein